MRKRTSLISMATHRDRFLAKAESFLLGDCRKSSYRIAQDVRLPSRSVAGSIAGLCDRRRDEEGERKDQQGGMSFDRNRLSRCPGTRRARFRCCD
jgi:hypothetical protein